MAAFPTNEPDYSSPYHPHLTNLRPILLFSYIFQVFLFIQVSLPKPHMYFSSPPIFQMPLPYHSVAFDHANTHFPPSYGQTPSSTISNYGLPLMREAKLQFSAVCSFLNTIQRFPDHDLINIYHVCDYDSFKVVWQILTSAIFLEDLLIYLMLCLFLSFCEREVNSI